MNREGTAYIHTLECDSAIRTKEILPFETTWIDLKGIMLSEMSERERQTSYDIAFVWNLKQWYEWIYLQKRNWVTD